jgi:hypothetical protein
VGRVAKSRRLSLAAWAAVLSLPCLFAVTTGCKRRDRGADLRPPPGAPEWEGRFAPAFDDGYTREPINLDGRAPHDVLDQRLFASRLGHAALVALVRVDQVWGRGRYEGRQDQFLDVEIDRLLIGELPRGVANEQLIRIAGDEQLPGSLQGAQMLLFVRWAPGEQPPYHHHVMPADPDLVQYVEALVAHAKDEGVLDDQGRVRKVQTRKRKRRGDDEEPDEAPE